MRGTEFQTVKGGWVESHTFFTARYFYEQYKTKSLSNKDKFYNILR